MRKIALLFLVIIFVFNPCYAKKKKEKIEKRIYVSMVEPKSEAVDGRDKNQVMFFERDKILTTPPLIFEDDFIKIEFIWIGSIEEWVLWARDREKIDEIEFVLQNKTSKAMKLIWDESVYIDAGRKMHKLIPVGKRYLERDEATPPSLIPPNSKIDNIIYPADYIYFVKGWERHSLFYGGQLFGGLKTGENRIINCGAFITIEIDGEKKNYNFEFEILLTKMPR